MTSPPRPAVLVLGANGRIGLAAVRAFDAAGWSVVAQVRRDAAAGMPARATLLRTPLDRVGDALAGAPVPRVVVHALSPNYGRWGEDALPLAVAGMDIAERLGARFMLPASVYNFGAAMPALLAEDTPQRPTTEKGRLRVEIEDALARRAAAGRLASTIIRAGDFFGAGSGSWFDQAIVKSLRAGKLVYPGPLDVVHAWAYLPDLARAFVALAEAAAEPLERHHFAGHSLTGAELLAAVERAAEGLGLAPARGWRRGTLPWPLLRLAGLVDPVLRELARMSYLWRVPHALDGRRLAARFPGLAATPIEVAVAQSLRDLGFAAPVAAEDGARAAGAPRAPTAPARP